MIDYQSMRMFLNKELGNRKSYKRQMNKVSIYTDIPKAYDEKRHSNINYNTSIKLKVN